MVIEGPSKPFTLDNLKAGGTYLVETFVETIVSDQTEATMNNFTLGTIRGLYQLRSVSLDITEYFSNNCEMLDCHYSATELG